jgi:hypothetical protein
MLHASDSTPDPITAVMMCAIAVHNVPARAAAAAHACACTTTNGELLMS